jgi:hypothetical protein
LSKPTAAPRRIVLIDNGLHQQIGHHTHFARGMARLLAASQRPFLVLAHRSMEPALAAPPHEARPVFELQ